MTDRFLVRYCFWIAFITLALSLPAMGRQRVVFVGASITAGHGTPNPAVCSYPAQTGQLLGSGYEVVNLGVGGTTMLTKGDYPYIYKGRMNEALASNPDIVIIDLGGNDSKAVNRQHLNEFEDDA